MIRLNKRSIGRNLRIDYTSVRETLNGEVLGVYDEQGIESYCIRGSVSPQTYKHHIVIGELPNTNDNRFQQMVSEGLAIYNPINDSWIALCIEPNSNDLVRPNHCHISFTPGFDCNMNKSTTNYRNYIGFDDCDDSFTLCLVKDTDTIIMPVFITKNTARWYPFNIRLTQTQFLDCIETIFANVPTIDRISFISTYCCPIRHESYGLEFRESSFWQLALPEDYLTLMMRVRSKFRSKIKADFYALERDYGPTVIDVIETCDIDSNVLDDFYRLKKMKYPNYTREWLPLPNFYTSRFPITTIYRLRLLNTGETIAMALINDEYEFPAILNLAYNTRFNRYAVGKTLYLRLLKLLIEQGCEGIDLGAGVNEQYKHYFKSTEYYYWIGDYYRVL